jgi:hypothetical protein
VNTFADAHFRYVFIDTSAPQIMSVTKSHTEITTDNVTVTVTVRYPSLVVGHNSTHSLNTLEVVGGSIGGLLAEPIGVSYNSVTGLHTYTYIFNRNTSATIPVVIQAVGANGLRSATNDEMNFRLIDTINPQIHATGTNTGLWTGSDVSIVWELLNINDMVGDVRFEILRPGATEWELFQTGGDRATILFTSATSNGTYFVRIMSVTGRISDDREFLVRIDRDNPHMSIVTGVGSYEEISTTDFTNAFVLAHPDGWSNTPITVVVFVRYTRDKGHLFVNGSERQSVGEPYDDPYAMEYWYVFDITIFRSGGELMRSEAFGDSGRSTTLVLEHIRVEMGEPLLTVGTNVNLGDENTWTNNDVVFTLGIQNPALFPSNVYYQFQREVWNVSTQSWVLSGLEWNTIMTGSPSVVTNVLTFTSHTDNGRYRFRAMTYAGNMSVVTDDDWHYVNIDKSPTVFVGDPIAVHDPALPGWSNTSVLITIMVQFPIYAGPQAGNPFVLDGIPGGVFMENFVAIEGETNLYRYELTVFRNIERFTLQAFGANGTYTVILPIGVSNIDSDRPEFEVLVTTEDSEGELRPNNSWTDGSVRFDFVGFNSVSGITHFMYSTDGGATWDRVGEEGLVTFIEFTDEANWTNVMFMAVSRAGMESLPRGRFSVLIDKEAPKYVVISDSSDLGYTSGNVTIRFQVTYTGDSALGRIAASPTGPGLSQISGGSGSVQVWEYTFTNNGVIEIILTNANGLRTVFELNTWNASLKGGLGDDVINREIPRFSVNANDTASSNPANPIWWDTQNNGPVRFNFSLINYEIMPNGVVTYYYSTTTSEWNNDKIGWTPITASELTLMLASASGTYHFRALSDTGIISTVFSTWYVNIDNGPVTITNVTARPSGYVRGNIWFDFTVNYTGAPGTLNIPQGPNMELRSSTNGGLTQVWRYTFIANDNVLLDYGNGTVNILATNANGRTAGVELSTVHPTLGGLIDMFVPRFNVAGPSSAWTSADQQFVFSLIGNNKSAVTFQFSTNNGVSWQNVTGDLLLLNTTQELTYTFRAFTAAGGVANAWNFEGSRLVRIDKTRPTVEIYGYQIGNGEIILGTNQLPTDLTNQNITVFVRTVGGISGVNMSLFDAPQGSTLTNVSISGNTRIDSFTFTNSGSVRVRATGGSGLSSDDLTVTVSNIDKTEPMFDVIIPFNARPGTVVANGVWTASDVRFEFRLIGAVLSDVDYLYTTTPADPLSWRPVSGADYHILSNTHEAIYYFRAVSRVGNIWTNGSGHIVRIDKVEPALDIYAYRIGDGPIIFNTSEAFVLPAAPTNQNIIVFVKSTRSISGLTPGSSVTGGLLNELSDVTNTFLLMAEDDLLPLGAELTDFNRVFSFTFDRNGALTMWAIGGSGVRTDEDLTIEFGNISKIPPTIIGRVNDVEVVINGMMFDRNVVVFVPGYDGMRVEVWAEGESVTMEFVNGQTEFTRNGVYRVRVTDAWGNWTEVTFTVNKPNYILIVCLSVAGAALVFGLIWFLLASIRNKKALNRLIANAGSNDQAGEFVLYKKAK